MASSKLNLRVTAKMLYFQCKVTILQNRCIHKQQRSKLTYACKRSKGSNRLHKVKTASMSRRGSWWHNVTWSTLPYCWQHKGPRGFSETMGKEGTHLYTLVSRKKLRKKGSSDVETDWSGVCITKPDLTYLLVRMCLYALRVALENVWKTVLLWQSNLKIINIKIMFWNVTWHWLVLLPFYCHHGRVVRYQGQSCE